MADKRLDISKPVIGYCSPRGGSSLVMGIFVAHGFWTGKTFGGPTGIGSGGYVNHENAALKEFIKEHWKLDAGVPMERLARADLYGYCEQIIRATPWLFKGPSEYYPLFTKWFPEHNPVFIFRDQEQAVEAHVRRRGEKVRDVATRVVRARYRYMREQAERNSRAVMVKADDVIDGDYGPIPEVLSRYGIEFSEQIAETMIDRKIWTRSGGGRG